MVPARVEDNRGAQVDRNRTVGTGPVRRIDPKDKKDKKDDSDKDKDKERSRPARN